MSKVTENFMRRIRVADETAS